MNKAQALLLVISITTVVALAAVTYSLMIPPSGKSYRFVWQTAYFHAHASSEYVSDTFTITGDQWYVRRLEYSNGISAPKLIVGVHDAHTSALIGTCSITSSNSIEYFTTKGVFYLTIKTDQEPPANIGEYTDSLYVWEYR